MATAPISVWQIRLLKFDFISFCGHKLMVVFPAVQPTLAKNTLHSNIFPLSLSCLESIFEIRFFCFLISFRCFYDSFSFIVFAFFISRLRYIFKMALAVSLRRALLMLLTATIFVLMVLYWNQGGIKHQSYINTYEKSVGSREALSEFPM